MSYLLINRAFNNSSSGNEPSGGALLAILVVMIFLVGVICGIHYLNKDKQIPQKTKTTITN